MAVNETPPPGRSGAGIRPPVGERAGGGRSMKPLSRRNLPIAALIAAALFCPAAASAAQDPPPEQAPPPESTAQAPKDPAVSTQDLRSLLDRLRYDPSERGPLVVVSPPRAFIPDPSAPDLTSRFSLGSIAEAAGYSVVRVGGITAVVPR